LGLSDPIFRGVMRMGYKVPTPVQRKALPVCLLGGDVVCMARTGSGKTAAFVVPMLEKVRWSKERREGVGGGLPGAITNTLPLIASLLAHFHAHFACALPLLTAWG